jgi:hypothetical protein
MSTTIPTVITSVYPTPSNTPLPTQTATILPTTPINNSYLTVQIASTSSPQSDFQTSTSPPSFVKKPDPTLTSLIGDTRDKNHINEVAWGQVVSNNDVLKTQAMSIQAKQAKFMSPSGYGIYKATDLNKESLKMQKQEDIQSHIDYDNNLLIMTGAALTLCVLLSFQLYMN